MQRLQWGPVRAQWQVPLLGPNTRQPLFKKGFQTGAGADGTDSGTPPKPPAHRGGTPLAHMGGTPPLCEGCLPCDLAVQTCNERRAELLVASC
jgi:hypothetical protein